MQKPLKSSPHPQHSSQSYNMCVTHNYTAVLTSPNQVIFSELTTSHTWRCLERALGDRHAMVTMETGRGWGPDHLPVKGVGSEMKCQRFKRLLFTYKGFACWHSKLALALSPLIFFIFPFLPFFNLKSWFSSRDTTRF